MKSFLDHEQALYRLHTGHFDNAIANYREENCPFDELPADVAAIAERAAEYLPPDRKLQRAWHVLDLAPSGEIFPHVDNSDHLGEYIIGISCLSDAVMRFTPSPHPEHACSAASDARVDAWLPRRSLYVMAGECRMQWQHAVLRGAHQVFTDVSPAQWREMMHAAGAKAGTPPYVGESPPPDGRHQVSITRSRRMSIILREQASKHSA